MSPYRTEDKDDQIEQLRADLAAANRTIAKLRRAVLGLAARVKEAESAYAVECYTCAEAAELSRIADALRVRARDVASDGRE